MKMCARACAHADRSLYALHIRPGVHSFFASHAPATHVQFLTGSAVSDTFNGIYTAYSSSFTRILNVSYCGPLSGATSTAHGIPKKV
jgi:hypothetical protein